MRQAHVSFDPLAMAVRATGVEKLLEFPDQLPVGRRSIQVHDAGESAHRQLTRAGAKLRSNAAYCSWAFPPPSKLTPAKAAAETPRHKQIICQTRALYHRIMRQHGKLNHFEHFAADYLTAAEYRIVNKVVNDYIIRKLSAH